MLAFLFTLGKEADFLSKVVESQTLVLVASVIAGIGYIGLVWSCYHAEIYILGKYAQFKDFVFISRVAFIWRVSIIGGTIAFEVGLLLTNWR